MHSISRHTICTVALGAVLIAASCAEQRACADNKEAASQKPLRGILFTGGCCHDYDRQKLILADGTSRRTNIQWTIVHEGGNGHDHQYKIFSKPGWEKDYDVVLYNMCFARTTDAEYVKSILKVHDAGLPAVVLHCTMHTFRDLKDDMFREFLGVTSKRHGAKFPIHVHALVPDHPILQGMPKEWQTPQGELYHILKVWPTATALAVGTRDKGIGGEGHPCVWVNEYGKAKVFGTTIGHHNETMQSTLYLDLVTRGLLWTLDKLDDEHYHRVSPEDDAEAQKKLEPQGKTPTPLQSPAASQGAAGGKKVKVPENLALGKPTSASATQAGRDTRFAVDGDYRTRWCAKDAAAGYWWQVDLQRPETVTGCRIAWEFDGRRYRYKVEGSADGNSWTMLADATATDSRDQIQSHKFDAEGIRYVRLTSTELDSGSWMSVWEFDVLGTKLVEVAAASVKPQQTLERAAAQGLLAAVKAPDGFRASLFAAPPDVSYPACLAAAPNGEVFIGVDENGSLGKDPNRRQRIVRCIDTDDDGQADKFNVFAEKVGSVRGLFYDNGTVWALHPPLLRAFHDDDGDGVADRNEVLVSGLGTKALQARGADHCTNGFRVGIDGWLYIAIGDFGFTEAVGKDGRKLQLMGGGIVRVRPDGTELEIYARGLRNIYDVAIDPYMNGFTRDNTNDGGGWDIRLSHVIPTGHYGYPSLFKNFGDEIVQPLADYGGGSGTGVVFVDEPGLPDGFGNTLYTCDWGRNIVFMHQLTPSGAGFQATQQDFVQIPRPTDADVDGRSRIYVASWRNGSFSYKGDDVGFVLQLTPESDTELPAFPDLSQASDRELLSHLASRSHVRRLHVQHEILRRNANAELVAGLEQLAAGQQSLGARVAAIFTLKQLLGDKSQPTLLQLTEDAEVREFALRALADRKGETADLPIEPFVTALSDPNPRTRLQAAVALGRIGNEQAATALVPTTVDADPLVAHAAIKALVELQAVEACFAALDRGSENLAPGAARVLQRLHRPDVVDGLIGRIQRSRSQETRRLSFRALARLYYREGDWDGGWWGTRPDTSGPYFRRAAWDETTKIGEVLKYVLAAAGPGESKELLVELSRHHIQFGSSGSQLFKLAESDPQLRATALTILQQQSEIPAEAMPLLTSVATDEEAATGLRARALSVLNRLADRPEVRETILGALAGIEDRYGESVDDFLAAQKESGGKASAEETPFDRRSVDALLMARDQFLYDARHARAVKYFADQIDRARGNRRELCGVVLMALAGSRVTSEADRQEAVAAIDRHWGRDADAAAALLRAAGRTYNRAFAKRVAQHLEDPQPQVRDAARFAAARLRLDQPESSGESVTVKLSEAPFDELLAKIEKDSGLIDLGRQLFLRQGCVSCHAVSDADAPRGPMLADISRRYNRRELAESILKPSAKIAQGFETQWFETADGLTIDGFVVREDGAEIEIRNTEGVARTIDKSDIEDRGKREVSIMPNGLVDSLTPMEFASLLSYLDSLRSEETVAIQ